MLLVRSAPIVIDNRSLNFFLIYVVSKKKCFCCIKRLYCLPFAIFLSIFCSYTSRFSIILGNCKKYPVSYSRNEAQNKKKEEVEGIVCDSLEIYCLDIFDVFIGSRNIFLFALFLARRCLVTKDVAFCYVLRLL